MDTFLLPRSPWLGGLYAVLVLFFAATPARAEAPPQPAPFTNTGTVFAEGRTFTSYITSGNSRDRIVQLCVLCMAVALFIMMKKFAPDVDRPATERRSSPLPPQHRSGKSNDSR